MKLLLTGGTGFFGKAILRHLMGQYNLKSSGDLPEQVVVLSRSPDAFLLLYPEFKNLGWLRFQRGDVEDPTSLPNNEKFTHVLHAAADSTNASKLTNLRRYDQIVSGTRNLLNLAVSCGAKRFLLTSSGAVYGVQPPHLDLIPEDWQGIPDPLNPANAYGIGKRVAEHLCASYTQKYGLQTAIARGFAFVGPDLPLDVHFAIGNFIRDALWRDEITVAGNGTPLRSYLDQQDLAHWLLKLLNNGHPGQAYNVGSDQAISIAQLAHLVRDIVAPGKTVRILGAREGNGARSVYIPSIQKAGDDLGLVVSVCLEDAIRETAIAAGARPSLGKFA
jgi:UDP-glucuronate decarboxylase